ncbi:class I tRNA ligase family protein [Shigella flexneri]
MIRKACVFSGSKRSTACRWIPEWGKARIEWMVANRPDWCISRQRTWGVPMSLFVHKDTEELHPRTPELIEEVAKCVEKDGIQAWWISTAGKSWRRR